jgi:WD40 repeat protein
VAAGSLLRTLAAHKGAVTALSFQPNGKTLVSGGGGGAVHLWDIDQDKPLKSHAGNGVGIVSVMWDGTSTVKLVNGKAQVMSWDTADGLSRPLFVPSKGPSGNSAYSGRCALAPDGVTIVRASACSHSFDRRVLIECADITQKPLGQSFGRAPRMANCGVVAFARDSKAFAAGGCSGRFELWRFTDEGKRREFGFRSASHPGVMVTPQPDLQFFVKWTAALSPDGRRLAVGSIMCELLTGDPMKLGGLASAPPALSPDGHTLAVPAQNDLVFWDSRDNTKRYWQNFFASQVRSVTYSPDGQKVAAVIGNTGFAVTELVKLIDVASGAELTTLQPATDQAAASSQRTGTSNSSTMARSPLRFSPDGHLLARALDSKIDVWDVATGEARGTLQGHTGRIMSITYSPDGRTLVSAGLDGMTKFWDVVEMKEVATLPVEAPVTSVDLRYDGALLASSHRDGTVRLWDVDSRTLQKAISVGPPNGAVLQTLFTPEGRHLATVNGNGTVYILRLETR